jgi:hypothetical protein
MGMNGRVNGCGLNRLCLEVYLVGFKGFKFLMI